MMLYSGQIFTGTNFQVGVSFLLTPYDPTSGVNPIYKNVINTMARYDYATIDKITVFFLPRWGAGQPFTGGSASILPRNLSVIRRYDWDQTFGAAIPAFTQAVFEPGSKRLSANKKFSISWRPTGTNPIQTQGYVMNASLSAMNAIKRPIGWFACSNTLDLAYSQQARYCQFPCALSFESSSTFVGLTELTMPMNVFVNIKYRTKDCQIFSAPTGSYVGQENLFHDGDPANFPDDDALVPIGP